MEVEREFFTTSRYLREELGVKSLLIGNSDHGRSGYPMVASASVLDVVDGHVVLGATPELPHGPEDGPPDWVRHSEHGDGQ